MLPMCTIFCHVLKFLTALIFLIAINSLTRYNRLHKKAKISHTGLQALGTELIPVSWQLVRRSHWPYTGW